MTKQKQLSVINAPVNKQELAPAISKTYVNPLTGSLLVEPSTAFNELIKSVSIKYSNEQAELTLKFYSPVNNREFTATFYPIVPVISFQTAIPDYVKFNIFFSLTEDFEKYSVIQNVAFYPSTTQQQATVNTFTESAKLSADVYKAALNTLLTKYTLEQYLATLPGSSNSYSPEDFDAKVAHFFERAEFTQVFIRVQLASAKSTNVPSYELAASPSGGIIGIGISEISTRINLHYLGSEADIHRVTRSHGIKSLIYEVYMYTNSSMPTLSSAGRRYLFTVYPNSEGFATLKKNYIELSRITDFTSVDSPESSKLFVVDLAGIVTTYGVSIDFTIFPPGSPQRTSILTRFINSGFSMYTQTSGRSGPSFAGRRIQKNSYILNNFDKNNPKMTLFGIYYESVDYLGIFSEISFRNDLTTLPLGLHSAYVEISSRNQIYRTAVVPKQLYDYYSSNLDGSELLLTPIAFRQDSGKPTIVAFEFKVPFSKFADLLSGFNYIRYFKRTEAGTPDRTAAVEFYPDLSTFTVSKGVITQMTLKTGSITKAKTAVTVRKDAAKTINFFLPECFVILQRFKYQKVGAVTTYVPDSVLAQGILQKSIDGSVLITDTSGNTLTYTGNGLVAKDQVRLLADFKNLQDFYGIRNVLSLCDVKDYIEIARITV